MSIIEAVQEEVERSGYGAVDAVHVRIGGLSGVVPEALRSAYELAIEQTPFAHSRLVIEEVPIVIYCSTCGCERGVHSTRWFCCAECDSPATEVVSGRELEIRALEIAT